MKNNLSMVNMLKELYPHFEGTNSFLLESTGFLNEISLNPDNAVEIEGDINKGEFQVGDIIYSYNAVEIEGDINKGEFQVGVGFDSGEGA